VELGRGSLAELACTSVAYRRLRGQTITIKMNLNSTNLIPK
jgi:hypothetical protein